MSESKRRPWPLLLIGAPAAVAIWSGWVGLGEMAGFGLVHPLPGILPHVVLNTAITLPVGLEAYATYALGAWLSPGIPARARRFALWSAVGSLLLGMSGQAAYHLLAAFRLTRAPVPVIVAVSCIPVLALGFAAALAHLMRADGEEDDSGQRPAPAWLASPLAIALAARIAAPRRSLAEATAGSTDEPPAPSTDPPTAEATDRPTGRLPAETPTAEAPGEPPAVAAPAPTGEPSADPSADGDPLAVARVRRKGSGSCSDDEVRAAIRALHGADPAITKNAVIRKLKGSKGSIGPDRAGRLLSEVQAERPNLVAVN